MKTVKARSWIQKSLTTKVKHLKIWLHTYVGQTFHFFDKMSEEAAERRKDLPWLTVSEISARD